MLQLYVNLITSKALLDRCKAETRRCIVDHIRCNEADGAKERSRLINFTNVCMQLDHCPCTHRGYKLMQPVEQICRVVSIVDIFFTFNLDQNQMTYTLSAFSCRRLDHDQCLISAAHRSNLTIGLKYNEAHTLFIAACSLQTGGD